MALALGGKAARDEWSASRQGWITNGEPRVELESLAFSGEDLRGFDFSRCRFNHCEFKSCDLRDVDFSQSIFRDCDLSGSNIKGASFYLADLAHDKNVLVGLRFDQTTNMELN
ncbi:hypothetical protein HJG53_17330 [Sphingomonas sp. ID1715]|nr:hypothetical protein [Sphingomonas sp. ID1715]